MLFKNPSMHLHKRYHKLTIQMYLQLISQHKTAYNKKPFFHIGLNYHNFEIRPLLGPKLILYSENRPQRLPIGRLLNSLHNILIVNNNIRVSGTVIPQSNHVCME